MNLRYCTRCLMPETRPRIGYDERGVCNACVWADEKKSGAVDWQARWAQLLALRDKHRARSRDGFDVLVPVSGGKDSSAVAYKLKHDLGLHPLCVTLAPPLTFPVGDANLRRFLDHGYDHVHVTPNPAVGRRIARRSFEEQGQPLLAWIISVQTAVFRVAVQFQVPFVMFGEEGEVEYGGSNRLKNRPFYDLDDAIGMYLSGNDPARFSALATDKELYWWRFPSKEELRALGPEIAHWSYFENWDSYAHYLLAKDKCGLQEMESRCVGTYNNFAQTDTSLYDLHCYLMYLKFGFGRCTQDVGIDIRRGAMTRKQALALVRRYDGEYPEAYVPGYLEYFGMTQAEFDAALDRHANPKLFRKEAGRWVPTFVPA